MPGDAVQMCSGTMPTGPQEHWTMERALGVGESSSYTEGINGVPVSTRGYGALGARWRKRLVRLQDWLH